MYPWDYRRQTKGEGLSPTQRSLAYLRETYPLVQVVEHWNPYAKIRQDLFGIIDILCVGEDVLAVQTTSYSNVSARIKKIQESEAIGWLRKAGVGVVIHGWRKVGRKWEVRIVDLS